MASLTMDTDSSKLHCTKEAINVTTSIKEKENPDDVDSSFPLDHSNSQAVIKQEKDANSLTHEAHASSTKFPHTLHSPVLIKKESSTGMLNYDTCQVKTEPESEDEQSLEEEMSVHDPSGTAIKQEITDEDTMDHHLREEDEINEVPDSLIDENEGLSYTAIIEVNQQQHGHSDDECHTCRFCGKNFKSVDLLNKHMMTHPHDYACTYVCDYCDRAFKSKYNLITHKAKQQLNENIYSCDICGKTFVWHCQFKSHREICRQSKERPYSCDVCGKAFKLKNSLREHKECHLSETHYACNICNKTFKIESRLQRHVAVNHSSEKPFSCDLCGKAFKLASLLSHHKKYGQHSEEKPFSCNVCGKAFKQQGCLNTHLIIHSDERPYSCDLCWKAFKRGSLLKHHKKYVHSNEKPYSCGVCGKDFKLQGSLNTHLKIHSDKRPYSCDVCGKDFEDDKELCLHRSSVHFIERLHM